MQTVVFISFLLAILQLTSCDLTEPTDRQYNDAAHPPTVGDPTIVGIVPGEGMAGQVFFSIDSAVGDPVGQTSLLIDGQPAIGWWGGGAVGFDTRAYPEGPHTLILNLKKPGNGPSETGLLGYLGVGDVLFSAEVLFRQTVPFDLPARPFVPWDNSFRERPAIDRVRNLLHVLESDSVKTFSTLTNARLRSRGLIGAPYGSPEGLRHFALSADGTRLYVFGIQGYGGVIFVLNALTLDSLALFPAEYSLAGIVCGDAGYLYVSGASSGLSGAPGVLRVLNTATLTQLSELTLPIASPMKMVISEDRRTLFLASDGVCRVSVEGGTPVLQAQAKTEPVVSLGISPDAQRLFLAFNSSQFYGVNPRGRVTIANPASLDSTGNVELGPFTESVSDILPAGQDLYAVLSVWSGSSTGRVAKFSRLVAMTASWDFGMYSAPYPLQVSGDGRFLYASGGALCIPIP